MFFVSFVFVLENVYSPKCESCSTLGERNQKIMFGFLIVVALSLSLVAAWVFNSYESNGDKVFKLIDASVYVLVFIFFTTAIVAPNASLIQTFGWVCVKIIEKTVWSLLALAQTDQFAEWSRVMSTGNSSTDAWLFIAVIPIIMNTFMFLMFSRISRLKIPCLDMKIRQQIANNLEQAEEDDMMSQNGYPHNNNDGIIDIIDLPDNSMGHNNNSNISSNISSNSDSNSHSKNDNNNNSRIEIMNDNKNNNSNNRNKGANDLHKQLTTEENGSDS